MELVLLLLGCEHTQGDVLVLDRRRLALQTPLPVMSSRAPIPVYSPAVPSNVLGRPSHAPAGGFPRNTSLQAPQRHEIPMNTTCTCTTEHRAQTPRAVSIHVYDVAPVPVSSSTRVGLEEGDAKGLNVGVYFLTARASTSTCRLIPLGLPARGPGPAPLTGIALGAHIHAGNTDPCRASMVWSSRPNHRGGPKCLILLPFECLHLHSWEPRGFSMTSPWGRGTGECASSGKPTRIQQLRRTRTCEALGAGRS